MNKFEICISGNASRQYPTDLLFGLLWYSETEAVEIPKKNTYSGDWGSVLSRILPNRDKIPIPYKLNLAYISLVEEKVYEIEEKLPKDKIENLWLVKNKFGEHLYSHIVVGMGPYGKVAIWCNGYNKSVLVNCMQGHFSSIDLKNVIYEFKNIHYHCLNLIDHSFITKEVEENKLQAYDIFDGYMKQFIYRYLILLEKWQGGSKEVKWEKYKEDEDKAPEFDYIEESLFDGTHDKLHDEGLLKYHQAGKPKKLAIKWHIGKSEYSAYFWFEEEPIREVFDKFYGAHPDTKTDFIIRIDAENRKYELALYRYGLKEPQVIPENVYQLLVFKNKFEDYRSDNYNQERGAWIW